MAPIQAINHVRLIVLLACLGFVTGCAKNYAPELCDSLDPEYYVESYDPFEDVNRKIFAFNTAVDEAIVEPLARQYTKLTPNSMETGISNFFNNLKEPRNTVASLLTGDASGAASSGFRFVTNSTIGLAGFLDVAGAVDVKYRNTDFGQVFGHWGVGDGPYLVVPFLGPSNARDLTGSAVHNRTTYVVKRVKKDEHQLFIQNMAVLDERAKLLHLTDLLKEQPDPYLFARESYRQSRLNSICNR